MLVTLHLSCTPDVRKTHTLHQHRRRLEMCACIISIFLSTAADVVNTWWIMYDKMSVRIIYPPLSLPRSLHLSLPFSPFVHQLIAPTGNFLKHGDLVRLGTLFNDESEPCVADKPIMIISNEPNVHISIRVCYNTPNTNIKPCRDHICFNMSYTNSMFTFPLKLTQLG